MLIVLLGMLRSHLLSVPLTALLYKNHCDAIGEPLRAGSHLEVKPLGKKNCQVENTVWRRIAAKMDMILLTAKLVRPRMRTVFRPMESALMKYAKISQS